MGMYAWVQVISEPGLFNPLKLELQEAVSHMTWVLRTELGPLEEKRVLLTTKLSSLAPKLKTLNYMSFSLLCICDHASTRLTCVHGGQRGSRFFPSTM